MIPFLFACLIFFCPAEGDETWQVWLHDGNGRLVMVDQSGTLLHEVELPLPEYHHGVHLSFSSDGTMIAAVTDSQLIVYDFRSNSVINNRYISGIVSAGEFDESGTQLAFGVLTDDEIQQIRVMDIVKDEIRYVWKSTDYGLAGCVGRCWWPWVEKFVNGRVWFVPRTHLASDRQPAINGYVWDIMRNSFQEDLTFVVWTSDQFMPTNETLTTLPVRTSPEYQLGCICLRSSYSFPLPILRKS